MTSDVPSSTRSDSRRLAGSLGSDAGAALVTTMMIIVLMAGLTAGMTAIVMSDTKVRAMDNTRTQAFYTAHAGLEKLTADLGDLFSSNFAPTTAQVNALTATPPPLNATWEEPDGTSGYRIVFPNAGGSPTASTMTVISGPFQGLVGLATPYQMVATARLADRSEASLTRTLQTVAIPVFQFGIFSENDLSFFAGPNFNFGGRVHTNSNLFLAEGNGNTLTLSDRVTTVGEIVRTNLSNGWDTNTNYTGTVSVLTAPGASRNLARNEGSLTGTIGSGRNEPTWTNLSTGTYNHNIASGNTGAKRLDLPVTNFGAQPIDLIRRPPVNENVTNPNVLAERFFSMASLRILLSDTAAEITNLPTVTANAPVALGAALPGGWAVSNNANTPLPPFALNDNGQNAYLAANAPLLNGFIKIERQSAAGVWTDVTLEILRLGFDSPAYQNSNTGGAMCADLTPNAIIRLQRVLYNSGGGACYSLSGTTTNASAPLRHVQNVLFDPREGALRDTALASISMGGLMYYIELDARNLARWFRSQIPAANCAIACTGNQAWNLNGYTVYFSDRRGNKNAAGVETAEYGFEDIVNPASGTGTPNNILDNGEDFNGNGVVDVYGETPRLNGMNAGPYTAAARPWTLLPAATQLETARRNFPIFFRRALKITNGSDLNGAAAGLTGLTIASENPVYLQGNWNAPGNFNGAHVATSILADSVTLLSNNWNDLNSLTNPYSRNSATQRNATTTWYRLAIIAGKGISFAQPAGTGQDYGTDGGAHNFLRYIEDWTDQTLNFRGSIVSLYRSRQATGTYKCCAIVYNPPTRGYNFDAEFLTPALLPPRTPMFRDVNTTGFSQIIRAN